MIRVLSEARSLDFYRAFGFEERGRQRVGGDTATIVYLGLPGESARLLLVANDGRADPYDIGDGFSGMFLVVPDFDVLIEELDSCGIRPSSPPSGDPGGLRYCFFADPDGYRLEVGSSDPEADL